MKKSFFLSVVLSTLVLTFSALINPTEAKLAENVTYKSAVLIEKNSGNILFENNCHERLPIASVTKLMTVLLTLEELDNNAISLQDKVMVSQNASGMGGSQIFLDANQEYQLDQLLKSVIVASANDSSVALAEYIFGSENNFVRKMNEKANMLNLKDTHYANCTGLPTPDGYSSAYDQALVLKQVLSHELYHEYSSIWMEDFTHPSGRTTQMTNTNKLSRFYQGCTGGKTGSTNQAKFCLAVGAKRQDVELISVVLGVENSKDRFKLASDILNYGFENFESKTIFSNLDLTNLSIPIKGSTEKAKLYADKNYTLVIDKNTSTNYSLNYNLPNILTSVKKDQIVGNVEIVVDGVVVDKIDIKSLDEFNEASVLDYIQQIIKY